MLGAMTTNAQENNSTAKSTSDGKPVVTTLMSKKLAYACRKYPKTMGMILAYSTGADTPLALAWKLELMDEGAPEICEKLLWDIYENTDPLFQENLLSIGFTYSEVVLSTQLITYLKDEKEKQEKMEREESQRRLIARQDSLFNTWSNNGVPDDVSPTVHATIRCMDTVSVVKFIDSLGLDTAINYSFYVEIDEHGIIKSAWSYGSNNSNPKYLEEIIKRLHLQANPAKYNFNAISKSINMATQEVVNIREKWENHAKGTIIVKYNRRNNQCKIVEDNYTYSPGDFNYFKRMCKQANLDEVAVLQDIALQLEQTSVKGEIEIEYEIYMGEILVRQSNVGVISRGILSPKIIVRKIRKFSFLNGWGNWMTVSLNDKSYLKLTPSNM